MADLLNTPQFSLPFRVVDGQVRCHEQDTMDDRVQNAITVMRYRPGQRSGLLEFGIPDPVFDEGGIDLEALVHRIRRWEPDLEVDDISQTIGNDGHNIIEITFRYGSEE